MKTIKAIIADDSNLFREVLSDILCSSGKFEVIGQAANGKEAFELVKQNKTADVLILDCEMPVMNGLDALKRIMRECPLPVFMFSSLTTEGAKETVRALELGAVDFFPKPVHGMDELEKISGQLLKKIEMVVFKARISAIRGKNIIRSNASKFGETETKELPSLQKRKVDLIVIGSSTGGVQAIEHILPKMPITIAPIVWVQHIPGTFSASLSQSMNAKSQITVKEAVDGESLQGGHCYLAPGGTQLRVKKSSARTRLVIGETDKYSGHCPSVDILFKSVAEYYTDNVLGIILTGMGADGAEGLKYMHQKGAYILGQDEDSCIVYGMPRVPFEQGHVHQQLDIRQMAEGILKVIR